MDGRPEDRGIILESVRIRDCRAGWKIRGFMPVVGE